MVCKGEGSLGGLTRVLVSSGGRFWWAPMSLLVSGMEERLRLDKAFLMLRDDERVSGDKDGSDGEAVDAIAIGPLILEIAI